MAKRIEKAKPPKELGRLMEAVGFVAASWAKLEYSINSAIWRLSAMEDEDGACVTSQIPSFLSRMRALIALVHRNGGSKELLADLNRFSVKADGAGRQRNRIIHDPWYAKEDKFARLEITADRKLVFEHRPQTAAEVRQLAKEISDLIAEFAKLRTRIGGSVTEALEGRAKAMVAEARAVGDFSEPVAGSAGPRPTSQVDVLLYLIEHRPGRTAPELSRAIGAENPTHVAPNLQYLAERGKIQQVGSGLDDDPYRYYPLGTKFVGALAKRVKKYD